MKLKPLVHLCDMKINVLRYNLILPNSAEMRSRLSNYHSWFEFAGYFAPSKWVGYKDFDEDGYLAATKRGEGDADGRETEEHLHKFFADKFESAEDFSLLKGFLSKFGKEPNQLARLHHIVG